MAPRKTRNGPIWSFPFTRVQASDRHSILKAIPGFEIATDTVTTATNISSMATKNCGLVAIMVTTFLCVDDQ